MLVETVRHKALKTLAKVHLSLGSNLGDRQDNVLAAVLGLDQMDGVTVVAVSKGYETVPVGVADQPVFVNAAVTIETVLEPLELLESVKALEKRIGRRNTERWGPRVVDIDIVLWESLVLTDATLRVPHPEFRNRAFVLEPLAEIAPDAIDPETGHTVATLAQQPDLAGPVIRTVALEISVAT